MFAYCANNPVVFKDPLGFAHCMSNEYGGGGGFGAASIGGSGALADTVKGKEHGPIPRSNVKEPKFNVNPKTGERFQNGYSVRPATAEEIIKWDKR
ncbi:hypothetical protein [Clostridium sp.]|uniref:hypothetical protein n=1 Tax=Clostridium sp. TaxID=1506 RepID=UPI003217A83A